LTQPAVSLQIENLHESLQVALFTRTSRGLVLTRDGLTPLPYAQRAVTTADDVKS
jgi:DNA-binding transcriptional LysR family regulator